MTNLRRLNIGPMSDKSGSRINDEDYEEHVSAIREELHPDIHVCCDQHGEDEDIWEMYIHDGD